MHAKLETANEEVQAIGATRLSAAWISSADEFRQLESDWMDLFLRARRESAFLSFPWMFLWWKHWGAGATLAIITIRDDRHRLVALAPLYIRRHFLPCVGPRRLSFLADEFVGSDYLNILVEPGFEKPAVREIVSMLRYHRRDFDYMELRDAEESPVLRLFCSELEAGGIRADIRPAYVCHYIDLPGSFDDFLGGIGINLRGNFRRRYRNLQRDFQTGFETVSNPADLERRFNALISLHRMRFQQRGEISAFLKPGVPTFHEEALKALASLGWARMYLLCVNSEPVAALYGFSLNGAFQFFQCGTDPDWFAKFGVGQVLIGNVIREAIVTGHHSFDFLRGGEPYKTKWAQNSRYTLTVRAFDNSPASLMANGLYWAAEWLRTRRSRLRKRLTHLRSRLLRRCASKTHSDGGSM